MLAVAPAVDRRHLFFVLISAVVGQSLCGEGTAIRPHYYQLTCPMAVAELWTVTADTAVQALKNHLRLIRGSTILDYTGTRFLGGDLYVGVTYTGIYTVNHYRSTGFHPWLW